MVKVNQKHATIGSQILADFADLRGATFGVGATNHDVAVQDLQQVSAALDAAAKHGLLDPKTSDSVRTEIDQAITGAERGDIKEASDRVRKATGILQVAAPMAAIAGTLMTVWSNLSGAS